MLLCLPLDQLNYALREYTQSSFNDGATQIGSKERVEDPVNGAKCLPAGSCEVSISGFPRHPR